MKQRLGLIKLACLLLCAVTSNGQSPIAFDDICLREQGVRDNLSCPNENGTLICYPRSELCNGVEFCVDGSDEGRSLNALDCRLNCSMYYEVLCMYWTCKSLLHSLS